MFVFEENVYLVISCGLNERRKKNYWANFEDRVSSYALAQLFLTRKKFFFCFSDFNFCLKFFFLFIFQRTNREIFLFNTKVINKTNLSKCLRTTLQWLVSMKHQTKKQNSGNHMSNPWKVSQSMREKKYENFFLWKLPLILAVEKVCGGRQTVLLLGFSLWMKNQLVLRDFSWHFQYFRGFLNRLKLNLKFGDFQTSFEVSFKVSLSGIFWRILDDRWHFTSKGEWKGLRGIL